MANGIDKIVAGNIRSLRVSSGKSRKDIASILGLTNQMIANYENVHSRVSCGNLWEISRMLDKPISWFFVDHSK